MGFLPAYRENLSPSPVIAVPQNKCHKIPLAILLFLRLEIKFLFILKYSNIHASKWCYLHLLMLWNKTAIFKKEEESQ